MSTREMICTLITENVSNDDLELLYQLVLKFVPDSDALPDEIEALIETQEETEFISHNDVWD